MSIPCAADAPYENKNNNPGNNTCAWRSASNYTTAAQSAIATCCGPANAIHPYTLPNRQPDCFQVCDITNGTAVELQQNGQALLTCLWEAGAWDPYCEWNGPAPPKASAALVLGPGLGWVKVGAVGILVGTALCGL
ncbi:hypothetical protein LCER1_G004296 [Lachnellula cervina]|uniref:Uncharacterized protein n=1 Tax=Lachnellula cervina TaxID=1316786 RepID=A0A7D8YRH3_9HELO|nr:hypothetical protein LCER1_G004296 [Lachnellula cervina]